MVKQGLVVAVFADRAMACSVWGENKNLSIKGVGVDAVVVCFIIYLLLLLLLSVVWGYQHDCQLRLQSNWFWWRFVLVISRTVNWLTTNKQILYCCQQECELTDLKQKIPCFVSRTAIAFNRRAAWLTTVSFLASHRVLWSLTVSSTTLNELHAGLWSQLKDVSWVLEYSYGPDR